jgi:ribosome-binding protein aMBF1 (putative translation factor)
MSKTCLELRLQRLRWSIPRKTLARRLECSDSWLRQIESGAAQGPIAARTWREKYQNALEVLIAEKKATRP